MNRSRVWHHLRRIWIAPGLGVTMVCVAWSLLAYRPSATARTALRSGPVVEVVDGDVLISFHPRRSSASAAAGLLFFPGALVDPVASAPLARAVAEAGFHGIIVALPRRGALGGAEQQALHARVDSLLQLDGRRWVIGGHSRGGVVASSVAARRPERIAGLILIGTSHPRDVNLRGFTALVSKIVGTRDGLARPAEVRANADRLPISTRWIWIEGGNHSQFGWYGFQPLDRRAQIPRQVQQEQMIRAVMATLREVEAGGAFQGSQGTAGGA